MAEKMYAIKKRTGLQADTLAWSAEGAWNRWLASQAYPDFPDESIVACCEESGDEVVRVTVTVEEETK